MNKELTSLLLNKLSNLISVMDAAIVKDEDTMGSRVGISERDLLIKMMVSLVLKKDKHIMTHNILLEKLNKPF